MFPGTSPIGVDRRPTLLPPGPLQIRCPSFCSSSLTNPSSPRREPQSARFSDPHRQCLLSQARAQRLSPPRSRVHLVPWTEIQPAAHVRASCMCLRRRPVIFLGARYDPCSHRIPLDVGKRLPGIRIVHRTREIARLPEVSAPSVQQMEVSRIVRVCAFEQFPETVGLFRHHHRV